MTNAFAYLPPAFFQSFVRRVRARLGWSPCVCFFEGFSEPKVVLFDTWAPEMHGVVVVPAHLPPQELHLPLVPSWCEMASLSYLWSSELGGASECLWTGGNTRQNGTVLVSQMFGWKSRKKLVTHFGSSVFSPLPNHRVWLFELLDCALKHSFTITGTCVHL